MLTYLNIYTFTLQLLTGWILISANILAIHNRVTCGLSTIVHPAELLPISCARYVKHKAVYAYPLPVSTCTFSDLAANEPDRSTRLSRFQ